MFRGGGRVFGPRVRDYSQKVNKKVKRLARKSALSIKAQEKSIIVLEDLSMDAPKTSAYINVLKSLGLESKKSFLSWLSQIIMYICRLEIYKFRSC